MYSEPCFEIEDRSFRNQAIHWGYGQFSQVMFYDNYSRPDGIHGQESFYDVVERVINGVMSIRKNYYLSHGVHWDEYAWQELASRMAEFMVAMKWLPAGRGMWACGTRLMYERGAMALSNCFSGNTQLIANGRPQTFKSLVGQEVEVICQDGLSRKATVKSFGVQPLQRVTFKKPGRSNFRLEYDVTPNHEWILPNGQRTRELKVGNCVKVKSIQPALGEKYDEGFLHGFVFGDGSKTQWGLFNLRLCGSKVSFLDTFEESKYHHSTNFTTYTEPFLIFSSNDNWKAVPDEDKDLSYCLGFLEGVMAADAYNPVIDTFHLDNTSEELVDWVINLAPALGYLVTGHNVSNKPTNYGERNKPLHRLTLRKNAEMLLSVTKIESLEIEEEVFCVTEPVTSSFMLAGGVITGNCAYTKAETVEDFCFLMDVLMYGTGVGFSVQTKGLELYLPITETRYTIPDTREGWVESVRRLLRAYWYGEAKPVFDYSAIRPKGSPLITFGGIASGPEPLMTAHERIVEVCERYYFDEISEIQFKGDLGNILGVAVIAGNMRRGAEIMLCDADEEEFYSLKDYEKYPERVGWGWMSNNSILLRETKDFENLGLIGHICANGGDIGYLNLKNFTQGRLNGKAPEKGVDKAIGINPCGEIPLEHRELCNIAETFPTRCLNEDDWIDAARFATLYCSTIALLDTHQEETNRIIHKNRRIGVSIVDFTGWSRLEGLHSVIKSLRRGYMAVRAINYSLAEEANVNPSIRVTTMKPGGTIPKVAGRTAGVSHPTFRHTLVRFNVNRDSEMYNILREANIPHERSVYTPDVSDVFEFPIEQGPAEPATEVSIWEQAMNVVTLQREWADNAVSNTLYFKPKWVLVRQAESSEVEIAEDEKIVFRNGVYNIYKYNPLHEEDQLGAVLAHVAPLTKSISLLPHSSTGIFPQMPQEGITPEEYQRRLDTIRNIDWSQYEGTPDGRIYCDSDSCEVIQ